jgi:hypothetical protein
VVQWGRTYIEANAPGAAKGWKWQGSWSGLYCLIVDGCEVNNWQTLSHK